MADRVTLRLFRSLVRLARTFDANPALKALICRNHGVALPEPLDSVVARFLGGSHAHFYWPRPPTLASPTGQQQQQQQLVLDAVRDTFRQAPAGAELEGAFAGVRYLSGVLAVARKHNMLLAAVQTPPEAVAGAGASQAAASAASAAAGAGEAPAAGPRGQQAALGVAAAAAGEVPRGADARQSWWRRWWHTSSAATAEGPAADGGSAPGGSSDGATGGVHLASVPERGLVLVAHPACGGIFSHSAVLLCRHDQHQGSYGLILNKPLGSSLRHLHERLRQLQSLTGGGGGGWSGSSGGSGGGALFGGGGSGGREGAFGAPGFASAAAASASGVVAARGSSSSSGGGADMPAEQLQQMVDFLAWKDELAAAAAAAARPDHDEHGNWIEGVYEEPEDGEDSELEDEVSLLALSSGSEGEEEEEEGGGLEGGPRARGEAAAAELGGLLLEALRGTRGSTASEGEEGEYELEFECPEDDDTGVLAALGEALRRGGGGTVVMLDPEGQVWGHHLPAGDYSSQDEDSEDEEEGVDTAQDSPSAVADLVQRSLTRQDRALLLQQQRQQAAAGLASGGGGAASASSSGGGMSSSGGGAGAPGSKEQRFTREVDRLLAQASSAPASQLHPQQKQQQQQADQRFAPLHASTSASSLFGVSSGPSSSRLGIGGSGGEGAAAGSGSGGSSSSPTVSQLMALFEESPLFRGGPVPGVQVLHRRPRLGGELVLPPWGPDAAAASASGVGDATLAASKLANIDTAAAEAVAELEGGLVLGAELSRAQELVESGYLQPQDVRVCMGDCGWLPGQLEAEVQRGTWALVRATPAFLDLFGQAAAEASQLEPSGGGSGSADGASGVGEGAPGGGSGSGSGSGSCLPARAAYQYEQGMWSKCLRALGPGYAELAEVPRGVWDDLAQLEV